jgi:hypothetical protein
MDTSMKRSRENLLSQSQQKDLRNTIIELEQKLEDANVQLEMERLSKCAINKICSEAVEDANFMRLFLCMVFF